MRTQTVKKMKEEFNMYMREALIKTLAEMDEQGEFEKCISTVKKYKTQGMSGKRLSFFQRRREAKELEQFIEAYRQSKKAYGDPHWIPLLHVMPPEIMRNLICYMVTKYDVTEIKKDDEKGQENN